MDNKMMDRQYNDASRWKHCLIGNKMMGKDGTTVKPNIS